MRITSLAALAGAILSLGFAACKRESREPQRRRPAVIVFVPKLPGSLVVDTSGTEETERLTMVVPVSGDSVAAFYGTQLPPRGWRIRNVWSDSVMINMYATGPNATDPNADGPTLWLRVERQGPLSARYTLISSFPAARALDSARVDSIRRR